ncbi:MAG: carbohydrate kinase [Ignavibacteriaceae bacterium]|nr:carbohydrate kinase [Ignavibacteriaceae bacterium]
MRKISAFGEILFDIYPDSKNLGGAPLNFIYHINKLIGNGRIISQVGNDLLGREVVEFLDSQGLAADTIQIDTKHLTGVAMVSLDENGVPAFTIEENRAFDFISVDEDVINLVENETKCLYFGTLAQRNKVSRTSLQSLLNKRTKYFFDVNIRQNFYTEDILFQSLKIANAVKLNLDELKLLHKIFLEDDFDLHSSSKQMMKKFDIEMLAVTKGADGSVLFRGEETDEHKTEVKNVIDTVGAGDAFAAILCLGYLNKWELKKNNRLANEFAAEICMINGALPKDDKLYERYKKKLRDDFN